jgi:hypothetical protein
MHACIFNTSALTIQPNQLDATHSYCLHIQKNTETHKKTNIKRWTDVKATRRRCRNEQPTNQSIVSTMSTGRVPLNDGENLAVGAFGGIVETVVQSTCSRYGFVDTRVVVDDSFIHPWIKDEK